MFKGSLKSKTVWFGHVVAVLGIIQMNLNLFELTRQQYGYIFIGIAVATYVLRAITTDSLEDK